MYNFCLSDMISQTAGLILPQFSLKFNIGPGMALGHVGGGGGVGGSTQHLKRLRLVRLKLQSTMKTMKNGTILC